MRADEKARKREFKDALQIAWQNANWVRAKKQPTWERVSRQYRVAPPDRSPGELLEIAKQLNAAFGGKDLRKKKGA